MITIYSIIAALIWAMMTVLVVKSNSTKKVLSIVIAAIMATVWPVIIAGTIAYGIKLK